MEAKALRTYKIETLGCKLNFSETATIGKLLGERGFVAAEPDAVPDVCVVNTCSVTELADRKCRQHIRSLVKRYPNALMVVTGCYAQLKSQEVAELPGVDIVLGSEQKLEIAHYVEQRFSTHQKMVEVTRQQDIRRFLEDGDRCKVTVFFRGREIVHKDRGLDILERIVKDLEEVAKVDQEPRAEGRTLQMLLVPKK